MHTIEIFKEKNSKNKNQYRAIQGSLQAEGITAGQALDLLESQRSASEEDKSGTLVIVQRFQSDEFFNDAQQKELQSAMSDFKQSIDTDNQLSEEEKKQLEQLIDEEWMAAISRATNLIANSGKPPKKS